MPEVGAIVDPSGFQKNAEVVQGLGWETWEMNGNARLIQSIGKVGNPDYNSTCVFPRNHCNLPPHVCLFSNELTGGKERIGFRVERLKSKLEIKSTSWTQF